MPKQPRLKNPLSISSLNEENESNYEVKIQSGLNFSYLNFPVLHGSNKLRTK